MVFSGRVAQLVFALALKDTRCTRAFLETTIRVGNNGIDQIDEIFSDDSGSGKISQDEIFIVSSNETYHQYVKYDGRGQQPLVEDDDEDASGEDDYYDEDVSREDDYEGEYYYDDDIPGASFGVAQIVFTSQLREEHSISSLDEDAVWTRLEETKDYMDNFEAGEGSIKLVMPCQNYDAMCTIWSVVEGCDKDAAFMTAVCPAACQRCHVESPGLEIGAGQIVNIVQDSKDHNITEKDVLDIIATSTSYIRDVVLVDDSFQMVRNLCFNFDPMCSMWAALGECDSNPGYMMLNCAPACRRCEMVHYKTRCSATPDAPVIWRAGDLNTMFESIVSNEDYKERLKVLSRPDYLAGDNEETANYKVGPWIAVIDDFITEEEAARLIEFGTEIGYERSQEVEDVDERTGRPLGNKISVHRTSTNTWCGETCKTDPTIVAIIRRIEELTGIPAEHSEDIQLLKYEEGQFYRNHHDYIDYERHARQGPRILTVFLYLNNVEQGGETRFDWFGNQVMVTPIQGRVVLWPSVLNEDPFEKDNRTEHEAMPIIKGTKYGANAWLHLREIQNAYDMGC